VKAKLTSFDNIVEAEIIKRVAKFSILVEDHGEQKLALLRNTGRLNDLVFEGAKALCALRGKGKTTCELLGVLISDDLAALVDTKVQMMGFEEAVKRKLIPWIKQWEIVSKEKSVDDLRIDYYVRRGYEEGFVELKSAVKFYEGCAMYPDCPTKRGRKHLEALCELKKRGFRSLVVFVAAHPLAKRFKPDEASDPMFAKVLKQAYMCGVEVYALKIVLNRKGEVLLIDPDLPVDL